MGRMRGVLTGLGLGVVASGLVVALAVPLVPPAWRSPWFVWGVTVAILALSMALVVSPPSSSRP